jgi:hypothetical protein
MAREINESILAIVSIKEEIVAGGAPIFYAQDRQEQERLALFLSRILKAMVHDLENGVFILVKH